MSYITANDSPHAQEMDRRWWACSDEARAFAATYGGRFAPLLPHVVAENYDRASLVIRRAWYEDFTAGMSR